MRLVVARAGDSHRSALDGIFKFFAIISKFSMLVALVDSPFIPSADRHLLTPRVIFNAGR